MSWIWCCAIILPQKNSRLGVYHPHQELHHIKKENIGLIEVMGLAVLPSRLKDELAKLADAIVEGRDIRADEMLAKHADWVDEFKHHYESITKENVDEHLKRRGRKGICPGSGGCGCIQVHTRGPGSIWPLPDFRRI